MEAPSKTPAAPISEDAFSAPAPASAPAPMTQVFVSNISPSANEQSLASFFSFCGSITNLKLIESEKDKPREAVVSFDSEAAAKTALLLTNAVIADRPITVVPYGESHQDEVKNIGESASGSVIELSGDQIPNKGYSVPDESRTKISVIASLIAQGYTLGDDAIAKARSIDEQNHISERVTAVANATRAKLGEIDQQYRISQTMGAVASGVAQKAAEIDQSWKISEGVQHIMKNVSDTVEVISAKAKESPAVQTTMEKLSEVSTNVSNALAPAVTAVTTNATAIREQSNQIYQETKRERSGSSADSDLHHHRVHHTEHPTVDEGIELIPAEHNVDKILRAEQDEDENENENENLTPPTSVEKQ